MAEHKDVGWVYHKSAEKIPKHQRIELLYLLYSAGIKCARIETCNADEFRVAPAHGPEVLDASAVFILSNVPKPKQLVGDRRVVSTAMQTEIQRMFGEFAMLSSKSNVDPATGKSHADLFRPYYFVIRTKKVNINVHWNERLKCWWGYFINK